MCIKNQVEVDGVDEGMDKARTGANKARFGTNKARTRANKEVEQRSGRFLS
jgi:hypothetical protein